MFLLPSCTQAHENVCDFFSARYCKQTVLKAIEKLEMSLGEGVLES